MVSGNDREYLALDHVEPIAPAVRTHAFELAGGGQHATAAGSVLRVETVGPDTKVHLTFPYPFRFIETGVNRGASSRAQLLEEIFAVLGSILAGVGIVGINRRGRYLYGRQRCGLQRLS